MKSIAVFYLALIGFIAIAADTSTTPVRDRIDALRREIAHHDELYHREASPEISDSDYDRLKLELAALERGAPNAASMAPRPAGIGDDRAGLFRPYRHRERMLSLEKVYAESELRTFHARLAKAVGREDLEYLIEPKYDGFAVSVTFENGKLIRAVTRGNGTEGEDITANVLQIQGLPHAFHGARMADWPRSIELRGEIYVSFAEFDRVNTEREQAGEPRFSVPRNLAAGTIRQLDAQQVARRGLSIVFFGVGGCEPATALPATQQGLHAKLKVWGLPAIPHVWTARGGDELVRGIEALERARPGFGFPTDGAVVKLDSFALQREMGTSDTAPRWAIAYKFAPERVATPLRAITLQVGRTGVLTPVAEFEPVRIGGSLITRATLHNRDEIARRDIRVGDFVYIEKAGEIIPAVVGVDLKRRPPDAKPYQIPFVCPECYSSIAQSDSEVAIRCPNYSCPGQLRRRIEHFASKACVDIEGLGPAMSDTLVDNGWVKELPDLYRLRRSDLLTLGRKNEKSVDRLLAAIEKSKHAELWRVIHGLGLPQVGPAAAKELARQCGSLNGLAENGPRIVPILASARYQDLIADLITVGITPPDAVETGKPLTGKTFVLTGTLPNLTRAQATAKIEAAGGKVSGTISRNTQFVVVGADPGAKLEQARKLGVPTIDEVELLRMVGKP